MGSDVLVENGPFLDPTEKGNSSSYGVVLSFSLSRDAKFDPGVLGHLDLAAFFIATSD